MILAGIVCIGAGGRAHFSCDNQATDGVKMSSNRVMTLPAWFVANSFDSDGRLRLQPDRDRYPGDRISRRRRYPGQRHIRAARTRHPDQILSWACCEASRTAPSSSSSSNSANNHGARNRRQPHRHGVAREKDEIRRHFRRIGEARRLPAGRSHRDRRHEDNNDNYHAVKVTQLRRHGGRARRSVEAHRRSGSVSRRSSSRSGRRRSGPSAAAPAPSSDGDSTTNSSSSSPHLSVLFIQRDDSDRPRCAARQRQRRYARRRFAGAIDAPLAPDPDDPGPPTLRADGRPATSQRHFSVFQFLRRLAPVIAGSRPSIQAEEVNGVTRPPSAPVSDDRPIEDRAHRSAAQACRRPAIP